MNALKKIFLNNAQIKIISLIFGYAFWYTISCNHATNIVLDAPICFYNLQENTKISCKDKVKVELFAKRSDLYTIDKDSIAFHIDVANVKNMQNFDNKACNSIIKLESGQLLLPESVKMVRCYPASVAVKIEKLRINA